LFPSVLRFRLYQIFFRSDFLGAFRFLLSAFASGVSLSAFPTLSEVPGRSDRPFFSEFIGGCL
ncbi:hypothetical protein, partial [Streptomyces niveiscabiei]|uniref:hypothetical protein n=1 Tax=Streptomyces niveiscabiei TaxID=164115 RepID=UPI0038F6C339